MGIQQQRRDQYRALSNNQRNANKNLCGLAVAQALGVGDDTRYLHTIRDLTYAIRKRWSCRSVKTALRVKPGSTTVSQAAKAMREHRADGLVAYVVIVKGHAMLMHADGRVAVDTAPRKTDRRKVGLVYGVYHP